MKTTKIYTVLSLALIFAAVTSAFSSTIGKVTNTGTLNTMVRYHVNVSISNDLTICNIYQVEILDGQGQLVAPAKQFIPGVTGYDFFERGPAKGVRIAALVMVNIHNRYICAADLFTTPVGLTGPFLSGQTYRFDLYPQVKPIK
jgi:hypothetical protein